MYSAGVGMCGNNDSIEKHLFCRGGQNREGLAEIANIAMMEFAAHFNFPHIRRLCPCREKKVKPQSPFKTLANILQGFLFPALRVSQMFGGGPSEQEPFQTLLRFMESAQKSFQTQIRNPNPARPFYFSATSHYFPPFPFPNFFKRQWRAGKNVLRGECSGAGTENGKYWKEFCKSIDIFRKICFLGNHQN